MSIRWERPTVQNIRQLIKHPAFAGAYVYGRRHWRRVQGGGEPAPENRLIGQFVELWDHHEGYISKEEYLENQRILALNAKGPNQSQLGPGPALLGGRCVCARHGGMAVHYHPRAGAVGWSFRCLGDYLSGGDQCVCVPGIVLEQLVVAAVLEAIDVPVVEEAHRLWRTSQRDWRQRHRGLDREMARRLTALDRLKQRILEQEAGQHPRLRAMLEDEYEKAAAEIERFKQRIAAEEVEVDPFTEARWAELKRLCAEVKKIWHAPTTTDLDRKQLIRMLVEKIVIDTVEPERIGLSILCADGRPRKQLELLRSPYFHRLIWEWHLEDVCPRVMVERLEGMGARTQQANAWSVDTVKRTLAILVKRARVSAIAGGKEAPPARLQPWQVMIELDAAGLEAQEIAARLNARGLLTRFRAPWSASSVQRVLRQRQN